MEENKKKKKEEFTAKQVITCNLYAIRLAYRLSHKRVIYAFIKQLFGYLLWVFYSAYFIQFVLDAITKKQKLSQIITAIVIIAVVSLIMQGFQYYCSDVVFPKENIRIYQGLYKQIYEKSENVDLRCYEDKEFYDKFSMALDDMGTKIGEAIDNISMIAGGIIGGIIASMAMIEIDYRTIIFLVFPLIGNFYIAPKMHTIAFKQYTDLVSEERKIAYVNRVMYLSDYAKELRLSNISNVLEKDFNSATEKKSGIWKKYFKKSFFYGYLQYFLSYIVIFEGILLYGGYRALVSQKDPITFTEMAVLTSVMITASWVWVQVLYAFNTGTKNSIQIENMKRFFNYEAAIPEDHDGIQPERKISSIEFSHVSFSYGADVKIINDLSFRIDEGMNLAMVGHNGAGKTTIIKLLLRLYDPDQGEIKVNGRNIKEYNLLAYRRLFSCAFQDYKIFPGTVRYNVLMGRKESDETVWEALEKAGIADKIRSFPMGLDTILTKEFDEDGERVSGGQEQKIIVARAFIENTPIAVFDEPSSALDPISENELFNSIISATKGRIGIFICHRLSCVKDANKVIMLENGRVIENGTHKELLENKGDYYDMYRKQERNYFVFDETGGEIDE